MFANNNFAKVWKIYPNEKEGQKYRLVQMSTSRKNKKDGTYTTDFSGYVRMVGKAFEKADELEAKDGIKILSCGVTTSYNKEQNKNFEQFIVFDFEFSDEKKAKEASKITNPDDFMELPDDDAELPFA